MVTFLEHFIKAIFLFCIGFGCIFADIELQTDELAWFSLIIRIITIIFGILFVVAGIHTLNYF